MKKFLMVFMACALTAAAHAADMKFVTILSQPVGSFQDVRVTGTEPVQAEKIHFGNVVTLNLSKGALISRAVGATVSTNASNYSVGTLYLNSGTWQAGTAKIDRWVSVEPAQMTIKGSANTDKLVVASEKILPRSAAFEYLTLNGTGFFNSTSNNGFGGASCSWKTTHSASGNLLLECGN